MAAPASDPAAVVGKGYQGFGSFHSDNVEEMLCVSDDAYVPPPFPAGLSPEELLRSCDAGDASDASGPIELGAPLRRSWFLLDDAWLFVNHGAFGAACKAAIAAAHAWQVYCERQPLRFIDRELFPYVLHSLRLMAAHVRASPRDCVFIPHATYGLNVAIRAAGIKKGDTVFMLDIGYGSVKKMLTAACDSVGATLIQHHVRFPVAGVRELVAQVEAAMPERVDFAVFDHITSNTAIVLPVAELTALAHSRGARVLIDGAHGLQSQDLDVPSVGAEWYVTNCHKWFCSTKGVGMLVVAPSVKAATRPLIISHGYGAGFSSEFIWDGCRDYSGILALPTLLRWWNRIGERVARGYCAELLQRAIDILCTAWGTSTHAPRDAYSHMACVALPLSALPAGVMTNGTPSANSTHAKMVQDALHYGERTEVPVKCLDNVLYLRISAAAYNCDADYRRLASIVSSLRWKGDTPTFIQ